MVCGSKNTISKPSPNTAEDKAKTPRKSTSTAPHGARKHNDDPKTAQPRQKPQPVLVTHHSKSPGHPDIAQSATSPNSPKSVTTYSPDTHPHNAPPTRKSRKPTFAPKPSVATLDDAPSVQGQFAANWVHYHYPSRSTTYQLHLPPSVPPSTIASVASANRHRAIISAMQGLTVDAVSQFELDPIPLAKLVRGHSS